MRFMEFVCGRVWTADDYLALKQACVRLCARQFDDRQPELYIDRFGYEGEQFNEKLDPQLALIVFGLMGIVCRKDQAALEAGKLSAAQVYLDWQHPRQHPQPGSQIWKVQPGLDRLIEQQQQAEDAGYCVWATNGCFDLTHTGHTELFEQARILGGIHSWLAVMLDRDIFLRMLKGSERPFNLSSHDRIAKTAESMHVNAVFMQGTLDRFFIPAQYPKELLGLYRDFVRHYWFYVYSNLLPHAVTYGSDKTTGFFEEMRRFLADYGVFVVKTDKTNPSGVSTTSLVESIRSGDRQLPLMD